MNGGQGDGHEDGGNGNLERPEANDPDRWVNALPLALKSHPAVQAFVSTRASFIITNPRLPGNPIVYASPGFLFLTGYSIERVLGRNCRFLQGPETDPVAVARIREAVDNGGDIAEILLNYRNDGSTFWNQVLISGVWEEVDGESTLIHFIGLQHPASPPTRENCE
jgi:PAS domain S-box-containing protein